MRETVTLAQIQTSVLNFLRGRDDVVLFGAQAVNAYVAEPRMTADVGLLSTRAKNLADELQAHLSQTFNIAVRIREVAEGKGFRVYQVIKNGNRHLIDLRAVEKLPDFNRIAEINVLTAAELIASKVAAYQSRKGKPKSGTDWRDLAVLLLEFPEQKSEMSEVSEILKKTGADEKTLQFWRELVATEILFEDEDEDLNY